MSPHLGAAEIQQYQVLTGPSGITSAKN